MGTIRFRNDHFAAFTGYGDYVQPNLTICHVYYVEGLRHNLFSVGQFCDGNLKVAFRSNTFFVWNLEGEDLLTDVRNSNLYTISISEMAASSPVCLMSKATSTKSWLWHRRPSHLNFDTINHLTKKDLIDGLPRFNSLCYPTNDHDDLRKMKPKADIGIFIGYSESSRGFRIYNCKNKRYNGNHLYSSEELNEILSKEYLENLFGSLYEEYYETRTPKVSDKSAVNTLDNVDTPSSSSIIVEVHEVP
ncbi:integrase, catalytic region, zinc finger, CCHC-type containing protein [Tanacetum coccineum]